jgi:hypothetical protein
MDRTETIQQWKLYFGQGYVWATESESVMKHIIFFALTLSLAPGFPEIS